MAKVLESGEMEITATINEDNSLIGAQVSVINKHDDLVQVFYKIVDKNTYIEVFPLSKFGEMLAEQLNIDTSIVMNWYLENRSKYNN